MTPIQWRARMRMMLDDVNTRQNVAGEFWDDDDLNQQFDASQNILLQSFSDNGAYYLLQGLLTQFTQVLTQDLQTVPIPVNYFLSVGATIDNQPARLHKGGVGVAYENYDHYGIMIEGGFVVFKGGAGKTGGLWYIRTPLSLSVQPTTDRAEFDDSVYTAILYHAVSSLLIKDDSSNTRYKKYYEDSLTSLLAMPQGMIPMFDDALIP